MARVNGRVKLTIDGLRKICNSLGRCSDASAAAEDSSVWTVINATRRLAVVSFPCDSGAGYKCHDLLTYGT